MFTILFAYEILKIRIFDDNYSDYHAKCKYKSSALLKKIVEAMKQRVKISFFLKKHMHFTGSTSSSGVKYQNNVVKVMRDTLVG